MPEYWYFKLLVGRCDTTWCRQEGITQVFNQDKEEYGRFCNLCAAGLVYKENRKIQTGHNRRSTD